MSNRTLPIYELSSGTINNIRYALDNEGRHFTSGPLSIGNHPVTVEKVDHLIEAGKHTVSISRGVKKSAKVINIFELKDGTWLYSTPVYKLRKINGTTQKSNNDSRFVYPTNALAVYRVEAQWEDEWSLEGLNLTITKFVK